MPNTADNFEYHDLPADKMKTQTRGKGCGLGCMGCLAFAIAVPVLLILLGYSIIFHSSAPLKWVAGAITEDEPSFLIQGIRGSISKGFSVKLIEFKVQNDGENEQDIEASRIEGLTFKYGGLWKSIRKEELVVRELSAERMDIVFPNGYFTQLKDRGDAGDDLDESESEIEITDAASTNDSLQRFQINELEFANNRFRTPDGKTDIQVPLFRIKGLKIEGDDFDLEDLKLESNCLSLELLDAGPDQVEGHTIPYKRKIVGKVLPNIHEVVISTIDFEVELASIDGKSKSRTRAFGGAFFQASLPGDSGIVRFRDFTISDYLDCEGQIIPERLNLDASQTKNTLDVENGEFYLGRTQFKIPAQQIDTKDEASTILGVATVGGEPLSLLLKPNHDQNWPPFIVTLETQGSATKKDLIAGIYFARSYAELTKDEKSRVDELAESAGIQTPGRE